MPSEAPLSGRCYCGTVRFRAAEPIAVTYCHCADCRRVTGAPVGVFVSFAEAEVDFEPKLGAGVSHAKGVRRWFCRECGSPLAATYDYLPGQIYVPIGLFDDASTLAPTGHSHFGERLPWLNIDDTLPRDHASGRGRLNDANTAP